MQTRIVVDSEYPDNRIETRLSIIENSMSNPSQPPTPKPWTVGQIANQRRFIPNVPVATHRGEQQLFYDDLIKDRVVLIQFMSIAHHDQYPVTRNLSNVQRLLGDRIGKDVFVFSITSDPERDDVKALAAFAKQFSPKPGWLFLTGQPACIQAIKSVFFVRTDQSPADSTSPNAASSHSDHRDCSMGLMRYGNDAMGLWASVPTKTEPSMVVERLSWVTPRPRSETLSRGGPVILSSAK